MLTTSRPLTVPFCTNSTQRSMFSLAPRASGFIQFLESTGPQPLVEGWLAQCHSAEGAALESRAPAVVRDLVREIAESGEWAETHRVEAARLVAPYFRQDEALIRYVLTQPPDRVSYRMLTPGDDEMQKIERDVAHDPLLAGWLA